MMIDIDNYQNIFYLFAECMSVCVYTNAYAYMRILWEEYHVSLERATRVEVQRYGLTRDKQELVLHRFHSLVVQIRKRCV